MCMLVGWLLLLFIALDVLGAPREDSELPPEAPQGYYQVRVGAKYPGDG